MLRFILSILLVGLFSVLKAQEGTRDPHYLFAEMPRSYCLNDNTHQRLKTCQRLFIYEDEVLQKIQSKPFIYEDEVLQKPYKNSLGIDLLGLVQRIQLNYERTLTPRWGVGIQTAYHYPSSFNAGFKGLQVEPILRHYLTPSHKGFYLQAKASYGSFRSPKFIDGLIAENKTGYTFQAYGGGVALGYQIHQLLGSGFILDVCVGGRYLYNNLDAVYSNGYYYNNETEFGVNKAFYLSDIDRILNINIILGLPF